MNLYANSINGFGPGFIGYFPNQSISAVVPDDDSLYFTLKPSLLHFIFNDNRAHYTIGISKMQVTLKESLFHYELEDNKFHFSTGIDDNVLLTPDYLIDIGDGTYLLANGADYLIQQ